METNGRAVKAPRRMDTRTLEQRVRQHGGILEAIEWGIRSESIEDPELATVWRGIEAQYEELRRGMFVASKLLSTGRRAA